METRTPTFDHPQAFTHPQGGEHQAAGAGSDRPGARRDDGARRLRDRLARELGPARFERYFGREARLDVHDDHVEITVPSAFVAEFIGRRFAPMIRRAAAEELSEAGDVQLRLRVESGAPGLDHGASPSESLDPSGETHAPDNAPGRAVLPPEAPRPTRVSPRAREAARVLASLDDFVVGESNRLAHAAALRLIDGEEASLRLVLIHGGCGVGKTHLLQGAARRFREARPGAVVRCAAAEDFTNAYITAVRDNRVDEFRRRYRGLDLLCIDDAHFLAGKERTQSELLHTLDALRLDGARVLLASDQHPREVQKLSQQLQSRFMAGMVARLDPPDAELRGALVRAIAARRGLLIDDGAVRLLADRAGRSSIGDQPASVRELEGMVTQVEAVARVLPELAVGGVVGAAAVGRALGIAVDAAPVMRPRRPVPAELIIAVICEELAIDRATFVGRSRHARAVLARSLGSYLCRELTTMSYPEIARALGRPNHSTVITADKRVRQHMDASAELSSEAGPGFAGVSLREFSVRLSRVIVSRAA
ncbi:MAG: ATP-binding protein, partial [Phycisphaerae bacterium]|nr:ATP-binding protein [Phycisphaerae bacterium]